MIKIQTPSNSNHDKFQSYDDLFDYIVDRENHKMLELEPDFKNMQWSFTAYSPRHVQVLYAHMKDQHSENQLPLIEICTGDFANPEYHVGKLDLDIKTLKEQWVKDYCQVHDLTIAQV